MVRRLGLGKNNHLTYASLALNPRYGYLCYIDYGCQCSIVQKLPLEGSKIGGHALDLNNNKTYSSNAWPPIFDPSCGNFSTIDYQNIHNTNNHMCLSCVCCFIYLYGGLCYTEGHQRFYLISRAHDLMLPTKFQVSLPRGVGRAFKANCWRCKTDYARGTMGIDWSQ